MQEICWVINIYILLVKYQGNYLLYLKYNFYDQFVTIFVGLLAVARNCIRHLSTLSYVIQQPYEKDILK